MYKLHYKTLLKLTFLAMIVTTGFSKNISPAADQSAQPEQFSLAQNYPNPFNPATTIEYQVPALSQVTLKIYNILGQEIKILADKVHEPGVYTVEWNATNHFGHRVFSGVYFYKMIVKLEPAIRDENRSADEIVITKKMILTP